MLFTRNEIIELLKENSIAQPKAKYSNNVILQMMECLSENFIADLEPTRNGFAFNRGSAVECIIKSVVYGLDFVSKANFGSADLVTNHLDSEHLALVNGVKSSNIEIKFTTSFAPATHKSNKARKTMLVCEHGIYLMDSKNIQYTKAGKININNQNTKDLESLDNLMDMLGF